MDYGDQDNRASGSIPESGAIFLSNIQTKKECLERNVFALPSSHAEFVKHIKAGMVLFLFEFRKRELFGVYQASSDGKMDIVPHAFNCSGQRFPAQVRFRQIWHCYPITEREFQDAIRENYFSAKKFNFGLSNDQVRRLLYLFGSKKKILPQPRSEDIAEVAVMDRRLVGDDRHGLNERGYMARLGDDRRHGLSERGYTETTEYDSRVSSSSKGREDRVLVDNMVNAEANILAYPRDDFLAKKRRIGKEVRSTINSVAEYGLYNHFDQRTFCTDSPKDSLDEVRTLASSGRFLAVQMENEDRVKKIRHTVQSPKHFLDPSDVRAHDYTSMQYSTSLDDCHQVFASDGYGNSMVKHVIDEERLLLDDCVKRDHISSSVKSISDDNLKVCRQAREIAEDKEWLMNRELEIRRHLDCDGSTISASDHSDSLFHKIGKATPAGRFHIDENESNYGTCSMEGFSSENVKRPLHCDYRITEGRKYPIVEGRPIENMISNVPPIMAMNAGYFANGDKQTRDNARITKSERIVDQEASHIDTSPVMSTRYPLYPLLERNSSSLSDKFTTSHNFDLSRSTYDDATITRTVPYLPDYPNLSHGCSITNEAKQKFPSVQKDHPHDGAFGNIYPPSSNRFQQNFPKSEKSVSPLHMALEYGDDGIATCTTGLGSSLIRESSNTFVNPNFSMDMDLNTSAPVCYRGSLSSRLSPCSTDLENFEGQKGLLHYYSKSRDHHIAFDGNLPEASGNPSKGMAMSATDLAIHENQYRFSSNTNHRELQKISGANSNFNRISVFTRLSSKSRLARERNDIGVTFQDCYMGATADEVMEMLKKDNNLSPNKLSKIKVTNKPRESAVNVKKTQIHTETDFSTIEKKRPKNASQATANDLHGKPRETAANEKKSQFQIETEHSIAEKQRPINASQATASGMDEIPKATRTLDFKRRSERKNVVGVSAGSSSHSNPAAAKEEAKSSINSTFGRRKLVRPAFSNTDIAGDATRGTQILQTPAPVLDKDDKQGCETASSLRKSEIPNDSTAFINVLASQTCQEMDCDKEPSHPVDKKDAVARVFPSTGVNFKGHEHGNGDCHSLPETEIPDDSTVIINVLASQTSQEMDCDKGYLHPEDKKDTVTHVLPSTGVDLKGHEHGNGNCHINSSEVLKATSQQEISTIQTSAKDVSLKDTDATRGNQTLETPAPALDKDEKQSCETVTSLRKSEIPDDSTTYINVLSSQTCQEMDCLKEPSHPEDKKDAVAHALPSTCFDLKGHEHGNGDCTCHISSSEALTEASQQEISAIRTSVEGALPKDTDATTTSLNLPYSSLDGFELDAGCRSNLIEEKRPKKMKIILTPKKDVKASSQ